MKRTCHALYEPIGFGVICVVTLSLAVAGRWLMAIAFVVFAFVVWGLISVAFDLRYFGALVDDEDETP